jgi:hypothetical protein
MTRTCVFCGVVLTGLQRKYCTSPVCRKAAKHYYNRLSDWRPATQDGNGYLCVICNAPLTGSQRKVCILGDCKRKYMRAYQSRAGKEERMRSRLKLTRAQAVDTLSARSIGTMSVDQLVKKFKAWSKRELEFV